MDIYAHSALLTLPTCHELFAVLAFILIVFLHQIDIAVVFAT